MQTDAKEMPGPNGPGVALVRRGGKTSGCLRDRRIRRWRVPLQTDAPHICVYTDISLAGADRTLCALAEHVGLINLQRQIALD